MFNHRKEFCIDKMASFPAITIVLPEHYISCNDDIALLLKYFDEVVVPGILVRLHRLFVTTRI
jgi:hypothetical protein